VHSPPPLKAVLCSWGGADSFQGAGRARFRIVNAQCSLGLERTRSASHVLHSAAGSTSSRPKRRCAGCKWLQRMRCGPIPHAGARPRFMQSKAGSSAPSRLIVRNPAPFFRRTIQGKKERAAQFGLGPNACSEGNVPHLRFSPLQAAIGVLSRRSGRPARSKKKQVGPPAPAASTREHGFAPIGGRFTRTV